ncbi:MAG: sialidase family protein [Candidatus Latescibacterota bacterium]
MRNVTEDLGWKEHFVRKGDGGGGWTVQESFYRMLHLEDYKTYDYLMPFGIVTMDNGELVLVASAEGSAKEPPERIWNPVMSFSRDKGDTWSRFELIPLEGNLSGAHIYHRPMVLACLGNGRLTFRVWDTSVEKNARFVSYDYGRTWKDKIYESASGDGKALGTEGNPLVELDSDGETVVITELGCWVPPGYPQAATWEYFVRTRDFGRTWVEEHRPEEWIWQEECGGEVYTRSVSEGSLVRASNGWLVAAVRTDMPARYFDVPHDDSLEGTGVSISKDDGKTWSPMNILYDAGRHHTHLLLLPNGDIVMTLIVRDDIRNGKLASYRRGCEAIISHDNGLTWDIERKYVLDDFEYFGVRHGGDELFWVNGMTGHLYSALLDDGHIITAYGNYLARGASLIKWKAE